MEPHWLVRNEKKGRTYCAAKQWTRPIHKRRRENILEELDFSLIRTSKTEWWSLEEKSPKWPPLLSRSIPSTIYK